MSELYLNVVAQLGGNAGFIGAAGLAINNELLKSRT